MEDNSIMGNIENRESQKESWEIVEELCGVPEEELEGFFASHTSDELRNFNNAIDEAGGQGIGASSGGTHVEEINAERVGMSLEKFRDERIRLWQAIEREEEKRKQQEQKQK
jgi:hypothetical protein